MSVPSNLKTGLSKQEIKNELWRRGQLNWLLDEGEKILYNLFYNSEHKKQVWVLGRRSGKTYTLVTLALEQCIRQPNSIVKIVSPTKTQCNLNLRPIFSKLLSSCPEDIKPELRQQEFIYYFPNGSEIQMAGTDNGHAEKLRGGDAHIVMIDEAGSCKDLKNIVNSVLLPTTLITRGKIILATTPPKELDHEFNEFWEEAELRGSLVLRTFKENPRLTPEMIAEMTEELGGENTEAFRREMLCQRIKDSSKSVLPEATPELFTEIVREWKRPPYFDCYEGMDLGLNDLTVVLFGYFDFAADKLIIEQEIVKQGKDLHLDKLGQEIIATEEALWMNPLTNEVRTPYFRVSDHNLVAMNEIRQATHGRVNFIPARKDDKEAAINHLRMMLGGKKIIIHPRCTTLIRHLQNVKWASDVNRKTYARSPDDGHYDAVDALLYLMRSVIWTKNPYPAHYNLDTNDLYITNREKFNSNEKVDVYRTIFGKNRKRA